MLSLTILHISISKAFYLSGMGTKYDWPLCWDDENGPVGTLTKGMDDNFKRFKVDVNAVITLVLPPGGKCQLPFDSEHNYFNHYIPKEESEIDKENTLFIAPPDNSYYPGHNIIATYDEFRVSEYATCDLKRYHTDFETITRKVWNTTKFDPDLEGSFCGFIMYFEVNSEDCPIDCVEISRDIRLFTKTYVAFPEPVKIPVEFLYGADLADSETCTFTLYLDLEDKLFRWENINWYYFMWYKYQVLNFIAW